LTGAKSGRTNGPPRRQYGNASQGRIDTEHDGNEQPSQNPRRLRKLYSTTGKLKKTHNSWIAERTVVHIVRNVEMYNQKEKETKMSRLDSWVTAGGIPGTVISI